MVLKGAPPTQQNKIPNHPFRYPDVSKPFLLPISSLSTTTSTNLLHQHKHKRHYNWGTRNKTKHTFLNLETCVCSSQSSTSLLAPGNIDVTTTKNALTIWFRTDANHLREFVRFHFFGSPKWMNVLSRQFIIKFPSPGIKAYLTRNSCLNTVRFWVNLSLFFESKLRVTSVMSFSKQRERRGCCSGGCILTRKMSVKIGSLFLPTYRRGGNIYLAHSSERQKITKYVYRFFLRAGNVCINKTTSMKYDYN